MWRWAIQFLARRAAMASRAIWWAGMAGGWWRKVRGVLSRRQIPAPAALSSRRAARAIQTQREGGGGRGRGRF